ncbi:hypothetical protein [Alteromonas lipolytica]|uniref:Lipoprotein n=1 Tax=Alteromonas lipolytica TaxID=1856405 RepID=A0A1E8FG44_9ALTE|nr:hypothetical protein [Alteromonas lipolytica]OFI34915.1 hypothetical protein BFC17_15220 [Alteromonas lipolytica]GGF55063.1 hypothetical protein GCM10011338_04120 [Alteromonas lipolytica]
MFNQFPALKPIITLGMLALVSGITTGCVSKSVLPKAATDTAASITIYRSDELQGSLTDVYIGWDDNYFVSLAPKQFTNINIEPGFKTFKIRAHADWSNELSLDIQPKQRLCLMAEVNPQNVAGVNWVVSGYRLRQLPCEQIKNADQYVLAAK